MVRLPWPPVATVTAEPITRRCTSCGKPSGAHARCESCRRERREQGERMKAEGLCIGCGSPTYRVSIRCRRCNSRRAERERERALGIGPGDHWKMRVELPDPTVTTALRRELERLRREGEPFRIAWPQALEAALADCSGRESWQEALLGTKRAWRESYLRVGRRIPLSLDLLDGLDFARAHVAVLG